MSALEKLKLLGKMQDDIKNLRARRTFTKKDMCEVCLPVRDALGMDDRETLAIANGIASLSDIARILERSERRDMAKSS